MIPCPPRADLMDLLAERLPAEREMPLLAHVETCRACQEALEELTACCVPDGPAATVGDVARPPAAPATEKDAFWRGLKAAFPRGPSTSAPGPASGAAAIALPARLGRYELLEEIGRGGMGAVLRGHDPDLDRDLAIKVLLPANQHDPAVVSRFTEEAQIGGQLQHPGIVPVYEVGQSADQRPYFTMKLVRGRTLAALLRERSHPGQDLPRLLQVFEQVCQTMAYAHSRGVIHRDLKPANVMVGAFGEVQVMDWGLAKLLAREGTLSPRPGSQLSGTVSGVIRTVRSAGSGPASEPSHVLGTPAYMAPEQASGAAARLDERCDVFGLGAILCEILTGQPPYAGTDIMQVLHQAARADLDEAFARLGACGADPELIRLARSSLAAEASDRPRDAGVLAAGFAAHRESMEARMRQAELAQAEARTRAEEERKRRRVKVALAAAGLALVLLAAGGGLWRQQVQTERRTEAERQEQALRQEVEATLTQAVSLRKGFHFREARELLEQAQQRLERAGPDDLRRRASQARDDLTLTEILDAARLQAATIVEGKLDVAGGERKYAAAFAGAGFDQEEDVTALAARVRDSAVREEIVAALDDRASLTPDRAHRARLLAVARAADPDRWRDRLRQPQLWRDRDALTKLAEKLKEAELSPQLATALGRALRQGGGDAVQLLAAGQARFPQDFWLNFELAWELYQARRWDDAAGYYRAALALRPQANACYNNLSVALVAQGRLDEAIDRCEQALRIDPRCAESHTNVGIALSDKGRLDEAIDHFQQALRIDSKLAPAHNNLGAALVDKGQLDEAIDHFQQALHLEPKHPSAHTNLGLALAAKGRTGEAIGQFEEALRLDPKDAPTHYNLGNTLKDQGRLDEAIEHYQQALALDPKHAPSHTNLGVVLYDKGMLDEAIDHYQQALHLDPKQAAAHNNLGNALQAQGRLDKAIEHFRQALALDPKYAMAHYNFANSLQAQGRLDESIEHYQRALHLDPKQAAAHYNLGNALQAQGRLGEAIGHYQQTLRLDPRLVPAHTNLGNALKAQGRPDKAIEHYQQALRIDPKHAPTHYNLGNTLKDQGRLDEAIEHYQQALRIDPNLALAHNNLGVAMVDKSRLDEAIGHYQQALRIDPKLASAHGNLGKELLAQGRFHEARAAIRRQLDLLPQDHPWRAPATQRLQRCEQLLALEGRLPAVLLECKDKPADVAEYLQFAEICALKGQYAAAACLSADAFAAKPQLAHDVKAGLRYNAACAAARAATGQGTDAATLDAKGRGRWRQQALNWLRADLALMTRLQQDGQAVGWSLAPWQTDLALASVRDRAALAKLPDAERAQWQRLWADVAASSAANPVEQGQKHIARREWAQAADCYARALKLSPTDNGHFWFEYAAVLLLSGDRRGYARTCARMVERCGPAEGLRAYHVARACTLAPDSVADGAQPGRLAAAELKSFDQQFWSLTEQGALHYRAGRFQQAVSLFEQSVRADPKPGGAVLNWLWLALAQHRLGKSEEARRRLGKAQAWLDQYRDGMPARAEEELGLHLHNWLEAHVLRLEAEALLGTGPAKPK
jgi:tetratricopeptide (TPR) repeat protein